VNSPALRFLSSNAWAMQPEVFRDLVAIVERHASGERLTANEVRAAVGSSQAGREAAMYKVGDTAVIPIRGVIARYADQVNGVCQDTGRSAESIQADIRSALADLTVRRIALRIDSPGGTVAGTAETGAAIKAATAAGKPVHAFVDGLAASAAYWLAASAESITASAPTAQAGSIGVITAHVDETAANDRRGYKVQVIRSVDLKAPGTAGEALTPEQVASIQRNIGQLHTAFADHVGASRKLDANRLAQVTTGEVWAAAQAQSLGLIDGVQSWESWLAALPTRGTSRTSTKAAAMNIEDLAALTDKHPAKASEIVAMAKAGKTAPEIEAHLAEASRTEEMAAIKTACESAQTDLKAEREAHEKTRAELKTATDKLAAFTANQATHRDPGQGNQPGKRRSEMNLAEKSAAIKEHGLAAYLALPE
jgi:signal peptide peptidase SppA